MSRGLINFESARIGFRNFAGQEGPFNAAGDRNFHIFMEEERAKQLEALGWNIKWPKPSDRYPAEEDTREPSLPVAVSFEHYPAKIFIVSGKGVEQRIMPLPQERVSELDWAEFENIDIVVRPYNWTVNKKSGIKAYLYSMYVTLLTDAFSEKYGL